MVPKCCLKDIKSLGNFFLIPFIAMGQEEEDKSILQIAFSNMSNIFDILSFSFWL